MRLEIPNNEIQNNIVQKSIYIFEQPTISGLFEPKIFQTKSDYLDIGSNLNFCFKQTIAKKHANAYSSRASKRYVNITLGAVRKDHKMWSPRPDTRGDLLHKMMPKNHLLRSIDGFCYEENFIRKDHKIFPISDDFFHF